MYTHYLRIFFLCVVLVFSFFVQSCTDNKAEKDLPSSELLFDSLPKIVSLPKFSGVLNNGEQFSDKSMKGKTWLVSFFFTSCGDICPKLNGVLDQLRRKHSSDRIRFLSISVDPATDTPDKLLEYATSMNFVDKRWKFMRIQQDSLLANTMDSLLIGSATIPSNHSARIILVDKLGFVRGYYDALDTQYVSKLEKLLNTIR